MDAAKETLIAKIISKKFEIADSVSEKQVRLSEKDEAMIENTCFDTLGDMNVQELWVVRELLQEIADEIMRPISITNACSEVISILDSIMEGVVEETVRLQLEDFRSKLEEIQDEVRELERNGIKTLGLEDDDLLDDDEKEVPQEQEEEEPGLEQKNSNADELKDKKKAGFPFKKGNNDKEEEPEGDEKEVKIAEVPVPGEKDEKEEKPAKPVEKDNEIEKKKKIEVRKEAVLSKAYEKLSTQLEAIVDELEAFLQENELVPEIEEPVEQPETSRPDDKLPGSK